MASFTLAANPGELASGVICPFESRWMKLIHEGRVKVVFRKKRLAQAAPSWLYAYMGTPTSAITAKLEILETLDCSLEDALNLASEGEIERAELERYAGSIEQLFVIRIGKVFVAEVPLTTDMLKKKFAFYPSPNFIRLSSAGVKVLDSLASFTEERFDANSFAK